MRAPHSISAPSEPAQKLVILVLHRLEMGGVETLTLHLLEQLAAKRKPVRLVVFLASGQPGRLDEAFRNQGVELVYAMGPFRGLAGFYRLCRQRRPDVVHSHVLLASGFYQFAAWLAGVPKRISHMHSTAYGRTDILFTLRNHVYRTLLNAFSTKVAGVSDATHAVARTPGSKWQTLYNGVTASPSRASLGPPWEPGPDGTIDVLFLARLYPQKNPVRALQVIDALRRRLPDRRVRLHYIGRRVEPMKTEVEQEIERLGLQHCVRLHGEIEHPEGALQHASVLLMTSFREGLPMVALEALSYGTPVVGSDIGPVEEIKRYCQAVRSLGLERSDAEWAEAIIDALGDDKERIRRSFLASPFRFDAHYRQILQLWEGA